MVVVKLKEEFVNKFPVKNQEELNKISLRVFRSLEDVIRTYENLVCKKSSYSDDRSFLAIHSIKGEIIYATHPAENEGRIKLKFSGDYDSFESEGDNCMKIYLYGNTDKIDLKIIDDLASKFKSSARKEHDKDSEQDGI